MERKVLFFVIMVALIPVTAFVTSTGMGETGSTDEVEVATSSKDDKTIAYLNKDAKVSDITKEEGKVNIYMFWGSGCPHCKAQWEFLASIRKKYPTDFAVYGFEVWYNKENKELLTKFAAAAGDDDPSSVPYTFIGSQKITGYGTDATTGEKIIEAIESEKKSGVDIYFDKVR